MYLDSLAIKFDQVGYILLRNGIDTLQQAQLSQVDRDVASQFKSCQHYAIIRI